MSKYIPKCCRTPMEQAGSQYMGEEGWKDRFRCTKCGKIVWQGVTIWQNID